MKCRMWKSWVSIGYLDMLCRQGRAVLGPGPRGITIGDVRWVITRVDGGSIHLVRRWWA